MIMQIIGVALGAISGVLLGYLLTKWLDKKYHTPEKAVDNYLVIGDKNDMKDIFTALLMEWYRQEEEKRSNTNGM